MTIKNKLFLVGGIVFLAFILLASMNVWTHIQIINTLEVRDRLNQKSADVLRHIKWEKEFSRLVSDTVASGHVTQFTIEKLRAPHEYTTEGGKTLVAAGKALAGLIAEKESAVSEVEATAERFKTEINDLYTKLDEKISTILAVAQMDKVLKGVTSQKTSLAPYVLKSLNQLTLVALNSLISREFTETQKHMVARNQKFLATQVHMLDQSGEVGELFAGLLDQIKLIESFISASNQRLAGLAVRIAEAKTTFDNAAGKTKADELLAKVQAEAQKANDDLEYASQRTLITVVIILFMVPVLVMLVGVGGLNRIIVRPITNLLEVMQQVGRGSYTARAKVDADDEVGRLATAFNAMAGEINAKVDELSDINLELGQSELKYRTLVENLPQNVFLKDVESVYISCNRKYADAIGAQPDDIIGKSDYDFFPPKVAEKYRMDDARIMAGGDSEELEETFIENGREMIVHTVKTPVQDREGNILGILGIFWDITRRIEAEREIRESRERLKEIFDSVQTGIVIIDKENFAIVDANPAAVRMIGASRDELLGQMCHGVLCPESEGQCRIVQQGLFQETLEQVITTQDGREIPVMKIVLPIHLQGREHLLESFLDISRLKKAEQEKDKLESQLRQAAKMEAIGTLAGGIAHDFNNILGAIIGYTELSQIAAEEGTKQKEYLEQVTKAALRAKDLVKQILTFSRLSEKSIKPLRLDLIVQEVLKLLRASVPMTIEIHQELDSNKLVMADPTQIHQVVMNLCTNASQAMGEEGGSLEVTLREVRIGDEFTQQHPEMSPGAYLQLTVSDTGYGMPPKVLERIFDPFYSTKDTGKGTGLGLSVAHGIVASCGGAIYAYSEIGSGSSFKVYLPVTDSGVAGASEKPPDLPGGNERILFVDDEEALVASGRVILESLGYRVVTASNGREASDLFRAKPDSFDLVITDQTMPEMTGEELSVELLAIRPDLPIVICTGFSTRMTKKRAGELGIRAFLMKPLLSQDLAGTIRQVLDD